MPFYEYECQACKFYAEVMQKITEAPLVECPSCGKRKLKKLVSAPVFRLKGGGWYETDFKSDKESKRNLLGAEKEEAKAESKAESKAEGKEAKPAAAKEPKPEGKAHEPKAAAAKSEPARAGRSRVTVAGKPARRSGPRRSARRRGRR